MCLATTSSLIEDKTIKTVCRVGGFFEASLVSVVGPLSLLHADRWQVLNAQDINKLQEKESIE